ncbi:transglycosylase domain-containing protein [Akkermansiaceae bacterium]|nr:transglycosylase domain-containing protein [Akkermansiaceae bacterium]
MDVQTEQCRPIRRRRWKKPAVFLLSLVLAAALAWFALPWAFSLPPGLSSDPAATPVLTDRNGRAIRHLAAEDFTRSAPVPLSEIPLIFIDCTLAAEDKRFYSHQGIDLLATGRSAFDFLRNRRVVSGASTVTQQLAKISSPPAPRNLASKFREAMIARRLEMSWGKDRILGTYFARLDYGNLRISPTEAARFYLQKPLSDLSLGECALLAGLPQAPSRLNPIRNPNNAKARRDMVLDRLARTGKYGAEEIALARAEPLRLRPLRESTAAPWLNRSPGSSTRTTLDLPLQREIERIVREETAKLESANLRHAAVVIIENASGDILAMVSSADWDDARGGQLHGALTPRSPGSTLKPFTYLLGFRHLGHLPCTVIADIPTTLLTEQGLQLPENYDRRHRGPVTVRHALACSLNVPALRELNELGGPEKLYRFLGELGISSLSQPAETYGLGLTLGNAPVKLLDLTNAYSTLARQGSYLPTRLFMDEEIPAGKDLIDPVNAWLISDILSDKAARAPAFSTGGPLDLPFRSAAKTGTSSDFRDNWCVGYTPEYTVGVWAGNFENKPMKGISGVSGAGAIFHRSMVRAHREHPPTWYPRPAGGSLVEVDVRNGKRLDNRQHQRFSLTEWLPPSIGIPAAAASDYDAEGRAKLPPIYADWYASPQNLRRHELVMDEAAENTIPLQIHSPRNDTTILLDPEIPGNNSYLRLETNLPALVRWSCETLVIEGDVALLVPGTHTLIATDTRDGTEHMVTVTVRKL